MSLKLQNMSSNVWKKKGQHKRPNCTWINMTRAWGGLTSILFNLLQSKKYKANRHSQPPYSIKLIIKKISRAYKSRILKKKGELTCIKIEYSVLPFTEIEGKKQNVTNHHTPLTWHLIHLSVVDRKIFIGIPKPCPTAQLGGVHKDHTTYKTAPVNKDLHVVSSFLSYSVTR